MRIIMKGESLSFLWQNFPEVSRLNLSHNQIIVDYWVKF